MADEISTATNDEKVQVELSTQEPTDSTQEKLYMKILKTYNETEHDGLMTLSNIDGTKDILYPITRVENVVDETGKDLNTILNEIIAETEGMSPINGIVKEYSVVDGANINKGDFVELTGTGEGEDWTGVTLTMPTSNIISLIGSTSTKKTITNMCYIGNNKYFLYDFERSDKSYCCIATLSEDKTTLTANSVYEIAPSTWGYSASTEVSNSYSDSKIYKVSDTSVIVFENITVYNRSEGNYYIAPVARIFSWNNDGTITTGTTTIISSTYLNSGSTGFQGDYIYDIKNCQVSSNTFAVLYRKRLYDSPYTPDNWNLCRLSVSGTTISVKTVSTPTYFVNDWNKYVHIDQLSNGSFEMIYNGSTENSVYIANYSDNGNTLSISGTPLLISSEWHNDISQNNSYIIPIKNEQYLWHSGTDFYLINNSNLSAPTGGVFNASWTDESRNIYGYYFDEQTNQLIVAYIYSTEVKVILCDLKFENNILTRLSKKTETTLILFDKPSNDKRMPCHIYNKNLYVNGYLYLCGYDYSNPNTYWSMFVMKPDFLIKFIQTATSQNNILGVAKTAGNAGQTIEVYVPNIVGE